MKSLRMINLTVSSTFAYGFVIIMASFNPTQTPKHIFTPKAGGNGLIASTVAISAHALKNVKGLTQKNSFENIKLDNSDEHKMAYWIGSVPEILKDSINTDELLFVDSTIFNEAVPNTIEEVYINADGVPNIDSFINGIAFNSIVQNRIRIVVYNDRTSEKDEQLIVALGGVNTFDADFTIINYKESGGRSIVPVGNHDTWYKAKRLSIFQKVVLDTTYVDDVSRSNARVAAIPCSNRPELWKPKLYAQNIRPLDEAVSKTYKRIIKAKVPFTESLYYVNGIKECEKFWIARVERVIKSTVVERGQLRTRMQAGTGTQTHRENQLRTTSKTIGKTYDFGMSLALGRKIEFDVAGFKASISTKVKHSYKESRSDGVTSAFTISEGHTFYTNGCANACCDYEGGIDVLQDIYEVKLVPIGDIWVKYRSYIKLSSNYRGHFTPIAYALKKPVILRYKFTRSSPFYSKYKEMSEMYISFEMRKLDKNCKPKDCYAYKSGLCNGSVK